MTIPPRNLRHIEAALRLYQGEGALDQLEGELARARCKRVLVITGKTLGEGPALVRLRAALGPRFVGVFSGVRPHAPIPSVHDAVASLRDLKADGVVALGGGSAIVTARAAVVMLAEGQDLDGICSKIDASGRFSSPKLSATKLPIFLCPTTPSTAAVTAGTAVMNPNGNTRHTMYDPKTRAQAIFVDPEFVASASDNLAKDAALDSLMLAAEGLVLPGGDMFSDAYSSYGFTQLSQALSPPQTAETRLQMVLAALLCGRGMEHSSLGLATVLGHSIGISAHVSNGLAKAILLPHVLAFNVDFLSDGLGRLGNALGLGDAQSSDLGAILAALEVQRHRLGLPNRLRDIRVAAHFLPDIAEKSMGDWFVQKNPRPVRTAHELSNLLQRAY